jgi:protocatechuate 3,4-dioxygenase beta subunit
VTAAAGASVRLAFAGPKVAPRVLEAILDAAGDEASEVRLATATALAGRVVDERGGPVVGATVTLWPAATVGSSSTPEAEARHSSRRRRPDGTFRFESASPEGNRLRVEAPAFATLERTPVRGGRARAPADAGRSARSCAER